MKKCGKCKITKSDSDFYVKRGSIYKFQGWCKLCTSQHSAELYKQNPEKYIRESKERRIKRTYGVSLEEYEAFLSSPCAICGSPSEHLDHDHISGVPREGLCANCNKGIGLMGDDPNRLEAAAKYLRRHNTKRAIS